ncbi:MAG: molybdenum cofactor biosynthesis protein MoaB, partial [Chloroflexi bacterium]|nr:molybdenum cofactor biosynthesis protein MoaB [Chloroflexota bacterium]
MTTGSSAQHRATAAQQGPIRIALVTVSDSRTPETDENAAYLRAEIQRAGHEVVAYRL